VSQNIGIKLEELYE